MITAEALIPSARHESADIATIRELLALWITVDRESITSRISERNGEARTLAAIARNTIPAWCLSQAARATKAPGSLSARRWYRARPDIVWLFPFFFAIHKAARRYLRRPVSSTQP